MGEGTCKYNYPCKQQREENWILCIKRKSNLEDSWTVGQLDSFEKREVEDDQPRANQAGQLGQQLPLEFRTAF